MAHVAECVEQNYKRRSRRVPTACLASAAGALAAQLAGCPAGGRGFEFRRVAG